MILPRLERPRQQHSPVSPLIRRVRPGFRGAPEPFFLAAAESAPLLEELRSLLNGLLGPARLTVVPPDGRIVHSSLRSLAPALAFIPMRMPFLEGLTLLRALPPKRAGRVVLLVPDTLEGYRVAWEALALGARDFLVTRGTPPVRFKGTIGQRLRQLAHLLALGEATELAPGSPRVPAEPLRDSAGVPWVVLAETRNLAAVASWLRTLPADAPVLLRVPEGPRMERVVREGLGRWITWPVRAGVSGDRLVPGHIQIIGDGVSAWCTEEAGRPCVRLAPLPHPPGSWGAHFGLLQSLRESTVPLRFLLPERDPERDLHLAGEDGRHRVFYLDIVPSGREGGEPRPRGIAAGELDQAA